MRLAMAGEDAPDARLRAEVLGPQSIPRAEVGGRGGPAGRQVPGGRGVAWLAMDAGSDTLRDDAHQGRGPWRTAVAAAYTAGRAAHPRLRFEAASCAASVAARHRARRESTPAPSWGGGLREAP